MDNAIIPLALKAVCGDLARSLEGEAVPADFADLLDAHLLPAIDRLLNASSSTADEFRAALNEVARVYADTMYR